MQVLRVKKPKWMPETHVDILKALKIKRVKFRFPKAAKRVLRKKKPILPSAHAERYRVVTEGDIQGPWQNIVTPWLVDIMDASDFPSVLTVIICKCVQSGGSESVHNCISYFVDRKPGQVMYVYPNRDAGKRQLKKRILPMFKSSPYLKRYLTGRDNDENNLELQLKHLSISIAWAHSPASLASDPKCYVVFDETDKYPAVASKSEADPISLGEKRTTTYRRRRKAKIWKLSTPTTEKGPITIALNKEAQVIFDYFVECPECGAFQAMFFPQIKWEGGGSADPELVESEKMAWYECEICGDKWDDDKRDRAVRNGHWRSRGKHQLTVKKYLETYKPKKIGFHVPAWISFFVSLSESASAFLRGLTSKNKMKDFKNNFAAEPWQEYEVLAKQEDEEVLRCKTKLPPQVVPESAVALTAGIDLQKTGFPYVVRAWAKDYTSWLIDYNQLGTWQELENLLFETVYPVENSDRQMRIWRAGLDTGGGKYNKDISSTEEAYLWLQDYAGFSRTCRVWGCKGSSNPLPTKMKMGSILNKTPSGKPLRMGMRLAILDTDKLKDMFYERMFKAIAEDQGGAYLHKETQLDYARQITAEEKQVNDKGVETWERIRNDNHYLDCECIASIVADWEWPGRGVNLLPGPVNLVEKAKPVEKKKKANPFTGGQNLFGA
ncbi:Phage terminase, large subunit GpA [Desulfobacula phenolica]|uniref:Phage terminase, large subunit GpA n=2 Tax=Desulfobacula phenolica TaxID=90732 RepID=A0A1H2I406_9BACT|nr:Phage terminase, large subunit GpA [Desulfobacula phenolica]